MEPITPNSSAQYKAPNAGVPAQRAAAAGEPKDSVTLGSRQAGGAKLLDTHGLISTEKHWLSDAKDRLSDVKDEIHDLFHWDKEAFFVFCFLPITASIGGIAGAVSGLAAGTALAGVPGAVIGAAGGGLLGAAAGFAAGIPVVQHNA